MEWRKRKLERVMRITEGGWDENLNNESKVGGGWE